MNQTLDPNRYIDYSLFNKLGKKIKSLLYIKRDKNFNPILSPEQQSLGFFITFTQDNRPYFPASKNGVLMSHLKQLGFFDVFSTNKAGDSNTAFGVYLSQVSLFLEYGINWVRTGFKAPQFLIEIHHLNSNVLDNRLDNLCVVSPSVHSFLSTLQVGHDPVKRMELGNDMKVYNNKGNVLEGNDAHSKLGWLVHQTLLRTKLWLKSIITKLQALSPNTPMPSSIPGLDDSTYKELVSNIQELTLDELYQASLDTSREHQLLGMSWNWLISVTRLSLNHILDNLHCAASKFLSNMLTPKALLNSLVSA